ncbi:MAG: hypothetical protein OEW11_02365 [Nitrospirota bacterium]|nr:hypothetical protein [Nitrospirota bacterium]
MVLLTGALSLLALIPAALAQDRPGGGRGHAPGEHEVISGGALDITGMAETPSGETRLPWREPEGFQMDPGIDYMQWLRQELAEPLDRQTLRRLRALEHRLSR